MITDPSFVDPAIDSRAATFENPAGERGAGGSAHGGRKGAPSRRIEAGERVSLADLRGPGVIRHVWMTFPPAPPEVMRALTLEVSYDGAHEPSVSVPVVDFFGVPLGRPVPYASALTAIQEGRGFNAYFPMPFRDRVVVEFVNGSSRAVELYYQIDFTLESVPPDRGLLHVSFRRENPTVMRRDFVIDEGLRGPGRFLGCVVGIRVLDWGTWYGEGEVKVYRDGDTELPTICGTGLEDYVGTAWGMGAHHAPHAGSPLEVRGPGGRPQPDFVGFYRWHVADPIMFERELRVTIQQIGFVMFMEEHRDRFEQWERDRREAGRGWTRDPRPGVLATGIAERVDDYSAASFVYCIEPQPVPRLDVASAVADIERREYEHPHPFEAFLG